MQQAEAEKGIRYLIDIWRTESGQLGVPKQDLAFSTFWYWLQANHAPYTNFRARGSARERAEIWFDQETGQMWKR